MTINPAADRLRELIDEREKAQHALDSANSAFQYAMSEQAAAYNAVVGAVARVAAHLDVMFPVEPSIKPVVDYPDGVDPERVASDVEQSGVLVDDGGAYQEFRSMPPRPVLASRPKVSK